MGSIINAGKTFLPFFYDRLGGQGFQKDLIEESRKKLRPGLFLITKERGFLKAPIQVRETLNLIKGHGLEVFSTQKLADDFRLYRGPAQIFWKSKRFACREGPMDRYLFLVLKRWVKSAKFFLSKAFLKMIVEVRFVFGLYLVARTSSSPSGARRL
jgi:hypothetical protein